MPVAGIGTGTVYLGGDGRLWCWDIFNVPHEGAVPKAIPGISAYRAGLGKLLQGQPVSVLPHEQIIGKLDEAGKTFKVLPIKTPLTKPYTSVVFQLECGYWNEASV